MILDILVTMNSSDRAKKELNDMMKIKGFNKNKILEFKKNIIYENKKIFL